MEHKEFAEVSLSADLPHQTTPDLAQNEPEASKKYDHSIVLLNYLLLSPSFTWNLSSVQPVLETATFLVFGIAICLIVSLIEYVRSHAERAHRQIQQLVTQLEQEKAQAAAQANELEAIVTAIVDGIYVYDSAYHVRRTNPAAQLFNPYTQQGDYLDQPYPDRFSAFFLRDEQGQPLMRENLPVTRVLQGEVLAGSHTVDITMRTVDGEDHIFNVSGAPVRGQAGDVQGAAHPCRFTSPPTIRGSAGTGTNNPKTNFGK